MHILHGIKNKFMYLFNYVHIFLPQLIMLCTRNSQSSEALKRFLILRKGRIFSFLLVRHLNTPLLYGHIHYNMSSRVPIQLLKYKRDFFSNRTFFISNCSFCLRNICMSCDLAVFIQEIFFQLFSAKHRWNLFSRLMSKSHLAQ